DSVGIEGTPQEPGILAGPCSATRKPPLPRGLGYSVVVIIVFVATVNLTPNLAGGNSTRGRRGVDVCVGDPGPDRLDQLAKFGRCNQLSCRTDDRRRRDSSRNRSTGNRTTWSPRRGGGAVFGVAAQPDADATAKAARAEVNVRHERLALQAIV